MIVDRYDSVIFKCYSELLRTAKRVKQYISILQKGFRILIYFKMFDFIMFLSFLQCQQAIFSLWKNRYIFIAVEDITTWFATVNRQRYALIKSTQTIPLLHGHQCWTGCQCYRLSNLVSLVLKFTVVCIDTIIWRVLGYGFVYYLLKDHVTDGHQTL